MRLRTLLLPLVMYVSMASAQKYVGGDISLLPEYENAKASYFDHSGKAVSTPLEFFKAEGMNAMRVRLFVNPSKYTGSDKDANACQDLEYVKELSKKIKDAGFNLMLDFHYSDTWADPAKQWTPAEWASLSDDQLYQKIYEYTKDVLTQMKDAGATPDMIQPGNEISYGMLWGAYGTVESSQKKCYIGNNANWSRFTTLLKRAIEACREVCPQAKVILHTERVAQTNVLTNFYTEMKKANIDYDIIGLSYYPYFHGNLNTLETAIKQLETSFSEKDIMIVETGYPYAWAVPGSTYDFTNTYTYSDEGQKKFTSDLITMLNKHKSVNGLFWWWMEYNAKGTNLSGWYNAPLFDSRTGQATSALSAMKDFLEGADGISSPVADKKESAIWYNLSGQPVEKISAPGVYIRNGKKVVVK